jgi:hypothetical protein
MTGFRVEIRPKRDFDRSVTVRSNWGLAFVFNKSDMGGGVVDLGIWTSGYRDIGKAGNARDWTEFGNSLGWCRAEIETKAGTKRRHL